jgi:hypothetical protein
MTYTHTHYVCTQQGREPADVLTTLYNRYVKQCIEYVLTGVLDGVQAEKLRQVLNTFVTLRTNLSDKLYQHAALTALEQCMLKSLGTAAAQCSRCAVVWFSLPIMNYRLYQ